MDNTEAKSGEDSTFLTRRIFADFMTGIARLEDLIAAGGKHLSGFHHGLELLRQRSKNDPSELVLKTVIEANDNERVRSYIEAGWAKTRDRVRHMREMNHCYEGLRDYSIKAKQIMLELESLVGEAADAVQGFRKREFEMTEVEEETETDATEYASFMAVIYSMVKRDFAMQGRIVSSLNYLTTCTKEVDSYCLMWSLRPFVDDDIVRRAFVYVP